MNTPSLKLAEVKISKLRSSFNASEFFFIATNVDLPFVEDVFEFNSV